MTDRQIFKTRFKALKEAFRDTKALGVCDYDNMRLLCVQLDGFTHRVIFDFGHNTKIKCFDFSLYIEVYDTPYNNALRTFFEGYGHLYYKHNAREIIYISPERR